MATEEQIRNTYATVEAMIDGAAAVMQRMHPEVKVRAWRELTVREQAQLAQAFHKFLTPLGQILTGHEVRDEHLNGGG